MWLCTQTFHFSWEKQNTLNRQNAELWILAIVAFITFPLFHETMCACPGSLLSGSVNSLQSLLNAAPQAPGAGWFLQDAEYPSWNHLGHASKARELRVTRLIHWLFGVDFPAWRQKSAAIAEGFSHRVWNMKRHKRFGNMKVEFGPLEVVPWADVTAVYLDSSKLQLGSSPVRRSPGAELPSWDCGVGDGSSSRRKRLRVSLHAPRCCFHEPLARLCSGLFPHNFAFLNPNSCCTKLWWNVLWNPGSNFVAKYSRLA